MKSSTNRGGHNANPLFSAFVRALLPMMLLLVGNVAVKAQTDVKFNKNVRYSQWVLDSRLGDFKGNTNAMGFATYKSDLTEKSAFPTWEGSKGVVLDYVAGLVAKAAIENAIWYKDFEWSKPWFKSVESYANHNGVSAPTGGGSLDNLNGAKMYFGLYTLANDESYISETSSTASTALTQLSNAMKGLKAHNTSYSFGSTVTLNNKSVAGGWFHKSDYENQMWLDGQYMGPALLAQLKNEYSGYTAITDDDWQLIANQLIYVWEQCWDSNAQLLYHAFSTDNDNATSHSDTWAGDAEIWTTAQTDKSKWKGMSAPGHSAAFWGRAEGWYFLALVDVLEQMEKAGLTDKDYYETLTNNLKDLAAGIAKYQNKETGCWYQLIAKDGNYSAQYYNGKSYTPVSNYLESSCTAIFTAAYLKAMRLGFLDTTYESVAKDAYAGLVTQFMKQNTDGTVHLVGCCKSAGLGGKESSSSSEDRYKFGGVRFRDGSNAYYLLGYDIAPTTDYTEGKVLGAFVMAATEYERAYQNQTENSKAILLARDLKPAYSLPKDEKISIEALGSSSVTYQWYKDGSAVAGATESSFVPTESGSYYCVATPAAKADGVIQSSTAEVTVEDSGNNDSQTGSTTYNIWFADKAGNDNKTGLTEVENIYFSESLSKSTNSFNTTGAKINIDGLGEYSVTKRTGDFDKSVTFTVPENSTGVFYILAQSNSGSNERTLTLTKPDKSTDTNGKILVKTSVAQQVKYTDLTPGTYTLTSSGTINIGCLCLAITPEGGSTEPTTYTVTYNNNGLGTLTETEVTNVTALPNPLPTLTETGWTFGGWYIDNTFENVATPGAAISKDTQLYAKWTRNTYKVTTSATNGTITVSATDSEGNAADNLDLSKVEHGTKLVFTANAQDGYVFSSWAVIGTSGTANGNEYTIESLDADTDVKANFKSTSAPTDGEICHFTGNTPSQSWTTVSGSYKTLSTGVTYKGVTYSDVVKMETSTAITVNSSETQTAIFVFDVANKKVKIDGLVYTTDKDGLVTLDLTAGTHTLKKGDVVNLVAIELVSNIDPEQDSRATFTYNNDELPFSEIKEGENTVHVAEIVLMKSAGVKECEVLFETAKGANLCKQGETAPLTSPIKVTAPTEVGEQSSYYTVTSKDGSSTTTYKITIKVIDQKRKIVLKYEPATFEWDAATQGKVTTDAFKTAWNANKPVLKAYLADESGNATTTEITPLPVGITYTPDIAGIVNVDASGNLNVIPGADGGVFVYAKLSNSAEYEESNEASCNVIITQGYGTVKLKKGEAAPKVNDVKYITANGENLVKITFGGWKYGKLGSDGKYDHSYVKPGATETVTDKWNVAKGDDKGELASIDGHKYGWPGANDAANEDKYESDGTIFGAKRYGWFKSPELDAYGKVKKTYPFTLPVRGTYATFEPQMNGTLTVYIIQNGAWNTWGSSDGGKSQTTNDGQTYKSEAFGIKKGEFRPHSFHVVNQRGLTLDQFATSWSVNTKQSVTSDYYCNPTDKTNSSKGDLSPNVADWGEFNDGRLTEKEKQDIVDAWKGGIHGAQKIVQLHDHSFLAIQKGVVKYTFHVTGHETYYFFSNFSKMGFCGARFVPDEAIDDNGKPMQPVAELELSDTEAFPTVTREPVEGEFYDENEQMPKYIYKYNGSEEINGKSINIEGGVQAPQFKTIAMNRTFKKGQWTTLSLPFNMTQSKVEEIFGVGTQLLLLDKATITNGTVKLHFLYHEIQNVLPGYPYLIRPTFVDDQGDDYPRGETAERTIDADGNLTRFVVPVKHINPDIKQQDIECDDYVAKCVAKNYSTGELTNPANGQTGYSVNYKDGDIFISEGDGNLYISKGNAYGKGYRSYIEKKQGTQSVKSISMAFSGVDDGEHNTPTEIKFAELAPEAVKALGFSGVYNLNGQYVGDTTENLPAGVYIANGRKVVIK